VDAGDVDDNVDIKGRTADTAAAVVDTDPGGDGNVLKLEGNGTGSNMAFFFSFRII
jgi:hypothetical protein